MPKTDLVAGEAVPSNEPYSLDDAQIDTMDLARQMQATYNIIHEMDYVHQDGTRNKELDHLVSVMRVTLQMSRRVAADMDRLECPVRPREAKTEHSSDIRGRSFLLICEMEDPLAVVRDLLRMINTMSIASGMFTDGEDACALQRTGWLATEHLEKAEQLRGELFELNHSNRDYLQAKE